MSQQWLAMGAEGAEAQPVLRAFKGLRNYDSWAWLRHQLQSILPDATDNKMIPPERRHALA